MIKVAVIGLGYWGPNLVRNFNRHPSAETAFVCDIDGRRLKEISRLYPGAVAVSDYRRVLDADVDLVAVSTPWRSHYKIARDFLESGKHVLVEKPFTATIKEAEGLLGLASRNNLRTFVNHTYIFHPVLERIKKLIASGTSGELYYFHSERTSSLLREDINALWDLAPHDLSMILLLFGRPSTIEVGAARSIRGSVDYAHIIMGWENGLVGHILVSRLSSLKVRKVSIGGSRRTIWWDDMDTGNRLSFTESVIRRIPCGVPPVMHTLIKGDLKKVDIKEREPLYGLVGDIVSSLKTGRASAADSGAGLEVVRLLTACDESIRKGGKRMRLR